MGLYLVEYVTNNGSYCLPQERQLTRDHCSNFLFFNQIAFITSKTEVLKLPVLVKTSTIGPYISLTNNRIALSNWLWGAFKFGSEVWVWSRGSLEVAWYAGVRTGWPLEARRSLFPDWPWLSDESSPVSTQKGSAHFCSNFWREIS